MVAPSRLPAVGVRPTPTPATLPIGRFRDVLQSLFSPADNVNTAPRRRSARLRPREVDLRNHVLCFMEEDEDVIDDFPACIASSMRRYLFS